MTDEATRQRYAITGWPAPADEERCMRAIRKPDGTQAQCRHRRAPDELICQQHQRQFLCCGGTDENPPSHAQDCNRKQYR